MRLTDCLHRVGILLSVLVMAATAVMASAAIVKADGDPADDYWIKLNHKVALAQPSDSTSNEPQPVAIVPAESSVAPFSLGTQSVPSAIETPAWIPDLSAYAHTLLRRSYASGHDPHLFTIAGDSNSNPTRYLGRITRGEFELGKHAELKAVADYYVMSFTHNSMATGGGFRAADMADRARATGFDMCHSDEGLYACELRTSSASIVFIQLGTGDKFAWREFESNYRAMIDFAIATNVLPILVTKADDIESIQGGASFGYINGMIRKLAAEYQLPLLDLYAATRDLPVIPNPALPTRPFTRYGLQDEWGYYFHLNDIGQDRHILITLQTLAVIEH